MHFDELLPERLLLVFEEANIAIPDGRLLHPSWVPQLVSLDLRRFHEVFLRFIVLFFFRFLPLSRQCFLFFLLGEHLPQLVARPRLVVFFPVNLIPQFVDRSLQLLNSGCRSVGVSISSADHRRVELLQVVDERVETEPRQQTFLLQLLQALSFFLFFFLSFDLLFCLLRRHLPRAPRHDVQVRDGVDLQEEVAGRDAQEVQQTGNGTKDLLRMQHGAQCVETRQADEENHVGTSERLLEGVDDCTDDHDQHDYCVDGAHQHRYENLGKHATRRLT